MIDIKAEDYRINNLDDEIRADQRSAELLRTFHRELLDTGIDPLEAGQLAHGADYFVRDFLIGNRRRNIITPDPLCVKQFAGHWYIIRNLEPNIDELAPMLDGIAAFYTFLENHNAMSAEQAEQIRCHCQELSFYRQRIADFWAIEDNGYDQWRKDCPLPSLES
ncbi:MAG: hypothetical protein JXR59_04740 [Desulfuromonadaceae bacterium]|nr:hypothetical protein [Desulfuromonadaceae bacterium]